MAGLAIMMIVISAALPTWRYIMKDEREQELIFRGAEIVNAIDRFRSDGKNGNQLPTSLDQLYKGHYLRRLYKDPMTEHDKVRKGAWKLLHQGEPCGGPVGNQPPGLGRGLGGDTNPSPSPSPTPSPSPSARPSPQAGGQSALGAGSGNGTVVGGPIVGVVSTSTEKSLRVFNGKTKYSEWCMTATTNTGQPALLAQDQWAIGSQKPGSITPGKVPQGSNGQGQNGQGGQGSPSGFGGSGGGSPGSGGGVVPSPGPYASPSPPS
jgi:type II secretory pathway pseudopilin PulG